MDEQELEDYFQDLQSEKDDHEAERLKERFDKQMEEDIHNTIEKLRSEGKCKHNHIEYLQSIL